MQTHRDDDHAKPLEVDPEVLRKLERKAAEMLIKGESELTAGKLDEDPLLSERVGRFHVQRLPDDELCTRISIGGIVNQDDTNYLVFRGDPKRVVELLTAALFSAITVAAAS